MRQEACYRHSKGKTLHLMATETLRWRFEDASLHMPGSHDAHQEAQPSDPGSLSALYRTLEQVDSVTSDRFLRLQDAALQQCQETDDSDLKRLRKHFKTLKNTFTVYDLKEGFIDGLLQGLPDGSEEEQLYQFEEEMERNSVLLRQYKSSNEQAQAEVVATMEALSQTRQEYNSQRDMCAAQLQQLHDEQAEYEGERAQMPPPSTTNYAALQDECRASLMAEAALQNTSEATYAAQQASIQELEAQVKSGAEAIRLLGSQVASMQEMRRSEAEQSQVNHRFVEHAQWCDAMVSALEALSGVAVVTATSDSMQLQLTTHINPSHPYQSGTPCVAFSHTLLLQLDSNTGAVQSFELQPQVAEAQAAILGHHEPSFVVREVQASLRHLLKREILLEEASKQFQLISETETAFSAQLPDGITADVDIPKKWPDADAALMLTSISHVNHQQQDFDDVVDAIAQEKTLSTGSLTNFLSSIATAAASKI